MSKPIEQKTEPRKILKSVKHTFTPAERAALGDELARKCGSLATIEAEFDQVKAGFKARTTACEAMVQHLSTSLTSGFEFRNKDCLVYFFPKKRSKLFFMEASDLELSGDFETDKLFCVACEDMTGEDFQLDLLDNGGKEKS